jgi:5'-methylthioadenosine phosphorylase
MTNLPEAKLAREAEICYATIALPTDYDCWKQDEAAVSVDAVVAMLHKNVARAQSLIHGVALAVRDRPPRSCGCPSAAQHAIMTAPDRIPPAARQRLELLIGRYLVT